MTIYNASLKRPSPDPDPGPMPPDPSPFPPPQPPLPDPQPSPPPPTRPPIPQLTLWMGLLLATSIVGWFGELSAQTTSGTLSSPSATSPTSASISPIQPLSAPTSGIPATVVTPATTNALAPSTTPSNRAPVFTGAGRGLPGMQGGPPLTGSLGARDPSSQYMSPPAIGPLFCDPAINIAC